MTEQTTELTERLATLEHRLRHLQDQQEIARLITRYGPLVDSGNAEAVAELWEPDGVYEVDGHAMHGHDEIIAMVTGAHHQALIERGCAHLLGPVHVDVDDHDAVAVGHSLLVLHHDARFVVRRATANRWHLHRGQHGWRVRHRSSRVLDGRQDSAQLLAALTTHERVDHTP